MDAGNSPVACIACAQSYEGVLVIRGAYTDIIPDKELILIALIKSWLLVKLIVLNGLSFQVINAIQFPHNLKFRFASL